MRTIVLMSASLLVLMGCASAEHTKSSEPSRSGNVGVNDISGTLANVERVVLAENESFIPPLRNENNRVPEYPGQLLTKNLAAAAVCMQVFVSEDGAVTGTNFIDQAPGCSPMSALDPLMIESVSQAISGWGFEAGLRCVFPDVHTKETTYGSCGESTAIPQPVTLTYKFMFEQKNGRGVVSMGQGE